MARTPSMTTQDAESALGPRGSIRVDSSNRPLVKKWLTAQGFPADFIGGLSMTELGLAYNQIDGSGLDAARRKLEKHRAEGFEESSEESATTSNQSADIESAAQGAGSAIEQAIRTIAERVMPKSNIDESTIRDLVRAEMVQYPTTRIEITRPDGTTHNIEGHKHPMLEKLILMMSSRQVNGFHPNILLVGPTGSGKTHAVKQASIAIRGNTESFRTNGAVTMDHQLIGFRDAAGTYHATPLRQTFGSPCDYLLDEIDSCDNSPLLCLAGLLANGGFDFPDAYVSRHPDSCILAAANTWLNGATAEFVGRNKIDGAVKSRFPVRLHWDYDERLERAICGNVDWACKVQKARLNAKRAGLKVTIDPRMSQAGAALIAIGMTMEEAASFTYLADLSEDQRKIVEAA